MYSPRSLLALCAFGVSAAALPLTSLAYQPTAAEAAFPGSEPIAKGKFEPTWESLAQYEIPEWYKDAKFGIWAHWGPQCQPEFGDWYGRRMYMQEKVNPWDWPALPFHTERYGHPSKFGFKDVINIWWAEKWEPEKLMALYKRAGAQYFMTLANHHDNFDLYDSKYQPWNSTKFGPKKDIVGGWEKAARKEGLRFAVSVHASHAWQWYETAQGADKTGPHAGVPYDGKITAADGKGSFWEGVDPQDLYAKNHPVSNAGWEWQVEGAKPDDPRLPSKEYMNKFYNRTVDLINKYHPDMVYFDDTVLPFHPISDVGLKIAAHFYNASASWHGGTNEAVINGKHLDEMQRKCLAYDIERGKAADILPRTWQTDTCIGGWHYERSIYERHGYKKFSEVIHMLSDVVSKNGNLMLNIPLRGDGTPDPDEVALLENLAGWMDVNREAIFGSRPWKVYGEGPSTAAKGEKGQFDGIKDVGQFTAADIRYTSKGKTIYAIVLGWPESRKVDLAAFAKEAPGIASVELLGSKEKVAFTRDDKGLHLSLPEKPTAGAPAVATVLKITAN